MEIREKYLGAVLGLIVGDALGVPGEFKSREAMKANPITDMVGFGTHNQPAGTWSDDSSMTLATIEWLNGLNLLNPDYKLLMEKFSNWIRYGEYTAHGETFDYGIATSTAIRKYENGTEPLKCGGTEEYSNGNGSLMRILPLALWGHHALNKGDMKWIDIVYNVSSLTHAHMRSKIACLIYSTVIAYLIYGCDDKMERIETSLRCCKKNLNGLSETEKYNRLWELKTFKNLKEEEIRSSGYVVDTLEAAIWCFLNTDNYKDCVLKAVNLGEDTDTVGAVAGGLAGVYYGLENIPKEWIEQIPKKEWIIEMTEQML